MRDTGGEWTILRRWDVLPDEEVLRNPLFISSLLSQWSADSVTLCILLELCRELWGPLEYRPDSVARRRNMMVRLAQEFRWGNLVLVEPKLVGSFVPDTAAAGSSSSRAAITAILEQAKQRQAAIRARDAAARQSTIAAKQKTWVAIHLQDEDGKPVPNERYHVVLPDGSVQEGSLNAKGEAYFQEIDPGQCRISFPDMDDKQWRPA